MDEKNQMDKEEIIKKFNAEIDEVRMGLMDVLKKNEYNPIIILYGLIEIISEVFFAYNETMKFMGKNELSKKELLREIFNKIDDVKEANKDFDMSKFK